MKIPFRLSKRKRPNEPSSHRLFSCLVEFYFLLYSPQNEKLRGEHKAFDDKLLRAENCFTDVLLKPKGKIMGGNKFFLPSGVNALSSFLNASQKNLSFFEIANNFNDQIFKKLRQIHESGKLFVLNIFTTFK
jgi:hypothetical protein